MNMCLTRMIFLSRSMTIKAIMIGRTCESVVREYVPALQNRECVNTLIGVFNAVDSFEEENEEVALTNGHT